MAPSLSPDADLQRRFAALDRDDTRSDLAPTRLASNTPCKEVNRSRSRRVEVSSRYMTSSIPKQRQHVMPNTPINTPAAKTPGARSSATLKTPGARSSAALKTPAAAKPLKTPSAHRAPSRSLAKTPGNTVKRTSAKAPASTWSSRSTLASKTPHSKPSASKRGGSALAVAAAGEAVSEAPSVSRRSQIRAVQMHANLIMQVAYARALQKKALATSEAMFAGWCSSVHAATLDKQRQLANLDLTLRRQQIWHASDAVCAAHNGALAELVPVLEDASRGIHVVADAAERIAQRLPTMRASWSSEAELLAALQRCQDLFDEYRERTMPADLVDNVRRLDQALTRVSEVVHDERESLGETTTLLSAMASLENAERSLRIHLLQIAPAD